MNKLNRSVCMCTDFDSNCLWRCEGFNVFEALHRHCMRTWRDCLVLRPIAIRNEWALGWTHRIAAQHLNPTHRDIYTQHRHSLENWPFDFPVSCVPSSNGTKSARLLVLTLLLWEMLPHCPTPCRTHTHTAQSTAQHIRRSADPPNGWRIGMCVCVQLWAWCAPGNLLAVCMKLKSIARSHKRVYCTMKWCYEGSGICGVGILPTYMRYRYWGVNTTQYMPTDMRWETPFSIMQWLFYWFNEYQYHTFIH